MPLIDADALDIGGYREDFPVCEYDVGWNAAVRAVKGYVDAAPTIDAVSVVRCAECKYWLCVEDGVGDCTNRRFHLDGCADPSMKMDDFCSIGERRSDD